MKITVNGEEKIITSMSVHEFLETIECDPIPIAVELNREILGKKDYERPFSVKAASARDRLVCRWRLKGEHACRKK